MRLINEMKRWNVKERKKRDAITFMHIHTGNVVKGTNQKEKRIRSTGRK